MNSAPTTPPAPATSRADATPPATPPSVPAARSCLYECRVLHHRHEPREHRFVYRLFYFALDLDELPALQRRLRLFSVNQANLFSFRERDFLPTGEPLHHPTRPPHQPKTFPETPAPNAASAATLKARVIAFCAAHGVALGPSPRVLLVTLPRVFGHQFNPVSFYFCFDSTGQPRGAIAEVTNTFHEVKPYFIPPAPPPPTTASSPPTAAAAATDSGPAHAPAAFRLRVPKLFYVSPFSGPEVEFDFDLRQPAARLAIRIDDFADGRRVLHSTLAGRHAPLTDATLGWFLLKYPLITLKIVALIHWQALRLWLKRTPFFRKADHADRQRDLYRPHASLSKSVP